MGWCRKGDSASTQNGQTRGSRCISIRWCEEGLWIHRARVSRLRDACQRSGVTISWPEISAWNGYDIRGRTYARPTLPMWMDPATGNGFPWRLRTLLTPWQRLMAEENDLPDASSKRERHMSVCLLLIPTCGLARVSRGRDWNGVRAGQVWAHRRKDS